MIINFNSSVPDKNIILKLNVVGNSISNAYLKSDVSFTHTMTFI
jgi:hypothetical protein